MIHLAFASILAATLVAFELGRTLGQRQILRDQRTLRAMVTSGGRGICRNRI
jgi:hypothetical protein